MLGTIAIWVGIVSGVVIIAGGVGGAYRWLLRRPDLGASWRDPETVYAMESDQLVFKWIRRLKITNRSTHADSFEDGEFEMHAPIDLRLRSGGSDEGVVFQVWIPGQPVIPPASYTSAWECRLTIWRPERWVGQRIEGVMKIRTIRKTFSEPVGFTVPPIPDSTE